MGGGIQGAFSLPDGKTFPTIEIEGHIGRAHVLVSCIEANGGPPYKCHQHKLVGTDCSEGICRKEIFCGSNTTRVTFKNLGIQVTKKRETEIALAERQRNLMDLEHSFIIDVDGAKSYSQSAVRLCFQVVLEAPDSKLLLEPIASDVLRDSHRHGQLAIVDYSENSAPVGGGKKILLFTEKKITNDIEVHFSYFDPSDHNKEIAVKGKYSPEDIHRHYCLAIKTPELKNSQDIKENIQAKMYLYNVENGNRSNEKDFFFLPYKTEEERRPVIIPFQKKTKPRTSGKAKYSFTERTLMMANIELKS